MLKSPLSVLVFFWGAWSGPCRVLSPVFERVSTRYNGQLRFAKLNVDEHQTIPARFGIQAIPTLLAFEKGKVTSRFVGPHPSGLEDLIHRVLAHEDITEYKGAFFHHHLPFLMRNKRVRYLYRFPFLFLVEYPDLRHAARFEKARRGGGVFLLREARSGRCTDRADRQTAPLDYQEQTFLLHRYDPTTDMAMSQASD